MRVVNLERTALTGHFHRCAVGLQSECLLNLHGEIDGLRTAVGEPERREHIAFGRDAQTGSAALQRLVANLFPERKLHTPYVLIFGVGRYFLYYGIDLFEFEVYDVVHKAHGLADVLLEQVEIELGLFRERILHVTVQIERQQAAAVVWTQRNFTARICRNGGEPEVRIAVGYGFADYGVPEQNSRFGRFPCVVYDFVPQLLRVDVLDVFRAFGVDWELLPVFLSGFNAAHEFVVDFYRDVGSRDLARVGFCVDEVLRVRVFYRKGQHQRASSAVLSHFAR